MELERIVAKCLQKNPEERYQTAADLIADLKHLRRTGGELVLPSSEKRAGSNLNKMRWVVIALFIAVIVALVLIFKPFSSMPEQNKKSIAVLPFKNLSDSREDEYFSDGITEDIIAQLSKVSDLKVISRTSIMQYKGVSKNVRDIGRELDVATVLEGSVRRAGNQIRIVAQLIDATNEGHLWADTYDKEITQVFSIQGDVAQRIVAALRARLSPSEKGRIEKNQTESTEAYELYLKGRFHWNKRMGDDLRMAVSYFTQAIGKDSSYALAYAGLAQTYVLFPQFFGLPTKDYYPRAESAARKALEYDVNLAEAYSALGIIAYLYTWDWSSAEREFRKAITLNPNYPTTHHWYCLMLNSMGRLGEAMNEIKRAQELDPLSPIITTNVGWVLFFMGRYDEAIGECEKALALDRNFVLAHWGLGNIYCQKGMYATAIAEYQRVRMLVGHSPLGLGGLGYTYARSDSIQEARKILGELLAYKEQNYLVSYEIALVYNGLMERDAALAWLERAFEERNRFVVDVNVDPALRNLHSAPRFKSLLQKMRLEK
jgi:TolB-like protein/Flp pilus assembly protein TadD